MNQEKSKNIESRLLTLEKRMRNKSDLESELSVDLLSALQKKLMSTIQEINTNYNFESSQKEIETSKKFKEEKIEKEKEAEKLKMGNYEEIKIIKPDETAEITPLEKIEEKMQSINNDSLKPVDKKEAIFEEINKLTDSKIDFNENSRRIEERNIDKKKNSLDSFVKITTPKHSLKRKPEETDFLQKETKKQAVIEEYFGEKISTGENSIGNTEVWQKEIRNKKLKLTKQENEKSPLKVTPGKVVLNSNSNTNNTDNICEITNHAFVIQKLEKEIANLKSVITDKDLDTLERDRELKRLSAEKMKYKEIHETFIENFIFYKTQVQKLLSKYLLECERYKKNETKTHLANQRHRLGEYVSQRNGSKFEDIWMDGYELRNLKEKLLGISNERQEKENRKKGFASKKLEIIKNENPLTIQMEKENLSNQIKILKIEEENLKEKIEKLNEEIFDFVTEYKNQYEEDHSKYGKPNNNTGKPTWPILNDRYQLLNLIGKGGFSEVYKGFDLEDFKPVACKIHELNPMWSESTKERYITHAGREIEIHKELDHLNIVKLYDIVEININTFCSVLEFCEGPDLGIYLKKHKTIPEKDAKIILLQIISGIKYLNQSRNKIIHYDLKPQNILFHKGVIKISDFGLCKIMEEDATKLELTSQGVGTYWYLPPECFQSSSENPSISTKVDIWSIGVIYYEMLFGGKPFGNQMTQEKILQDKIILKSNGVSFPNTPSVSLEGKELILKCLEYDQNKRIDIEGLSECSYLKKNKKGAMGK